jgi:hypothetical protein
VSYVPELLSDPHLTARGFWAAIDQPGFGVKPYPTLPYRLSRAPVEIKTPPPAFAQHNREVFCDLLGLSDAEFVRLEAARVISPEPLPYRSSDAAASRGAGQLAVSHFPRRHRLVAVAAQLQAGDGIDRPVSVYAQFGRRPAQRCGVAVACVADTGDVPCPFAQRW